MSTQRGNKKQVLPTPAYSEAFKRQVVNEYERGLFTKAELKRRYTIRGHSNIDRWLKKYGKFTYQSQSTIGRPMKDPQKQRIKELEAQLAKKEAELCAFKELITLAEQELSISIIKKSGSKQSKS